MKPSGRAAMLRSENLPAIGHVVRGRDRRPLDFCLKIGRHDVAQIGHGVEDMLVDDAMGNIGADAGMVIGVVDELQARASKPGGSKKSSTSVVTPAFSDSIAVRRLRR